MSAEAITPAGWYAMDGDPPGTRRWWDGVQWTSTVQAPEPVMPSLPPVVSAPTTPHTHRRARWPGKVRSSQKMQANGMQR